MSVSTHYGRSGLEDTILEALRGAGFDPDHLDAEALEPLEEFHTFGRRATTELADLAGIGSGTVVLDVGSGIGGPARLLARTYGAVVTGIDVTPEFVAVAESLSRRVGATNVTFRVADATDLPFEDDRFDVAWTQHVTMNIADKAGLYRELRRVVRDGGKLAFFDIVAGPEQPIHFPVPWADDESISFLSPPEEMERLVTGAGFRPVVWNDLTDVAVDFYRTLGGAPPGSLGIHLLIPDIAVRGPNLVRNVMEGRLRLLQAVCEAV